MQCRCAGNDNAFHKILTQIVAVKDIKNSCLALAFQILINIFLPSC
jgi:hypothetical protein